MTEGESQDRRQEPRRTIGAWGHYRTGRGVSRDVKILDVNAKGCRFHDKFGTLKEDATIVLRIGNIGPLLAYVRWTEGFVVGTEFEEPLYGPVLDYITEYFDTRSAEEKEATGRQDGDEAI